MEASCVCDINYLHFPNRPLQSVFAELSPTGEGILASLPSSSVCMLPVWDPGSSPSPPPSSRLAESLDPASGPLALKCVRVLKDRVVPGGLLSTVTWEKVGQTL